MQALAKIKEELGKAETLNKGLNTQLATTIAQLKEESNKNEELVKKNKMLELQCRNLSDELNKALLYKDTLETMAEIPEKELANKFSIEENKMLNTRVEQLEDERQQYKKDIREKELLLSNERTQHREEFTKLQYDYNNACNEITLLKNALKIAQQNTSDKSKDLDSLSMLNDSFFSKPSFDDSKDPDEY